MRQPLGETIESRTPRIARKQEQLGDHQIGQCIFSNTRDCATVRHFPLDPGQ